MKLSIPPIFLVIFVFSGLLKWIPLPIDITLLSLLCLIVFFVMSFLYADVRDRFCTIETLICLIFFLFYFLLFFSSSLYSVSETFWLEKIQGMILSVIALVLPLFLLRKENDFYWFNNGLLFLTALAAIILLGFYLTGTLDYYIFQGVGSGNDNSESLIPDYLVVGTLLSIGILISLQKKKAIIYLLSLVSLFCILLIGSRGPLVFLVLASLIFILLTNRGKSKLDLSLQKRIFTASTVVSLISLTVYISFLEGGFDSTLVRFARLFTDSEELAKTFRVEEFSLAIDIIKNYPLFGVGIGGYGQVAYNADFNVYPHNLILETAAELGIFSVFIFLSGFIIMLYMAIKQREDNLVCLYIAILFFELFNFMKSGGFISSRELYLFAGVLLARYEYTLRQTNKMKTS